MGDLVSVRFIKAHPPYLTGETAGFEPSVAHGLIHAIKVAVPADQKPAPIVPTAAPDPGPEVPVIVTPEEAARLAAEKREAAIAAAEEANAAEAEAEKVAADAEKKAARQEKRRLAAAKKRLAEAEKKAKKK